MNYTEKTPRTQKMIPLTREFQDFLGHLYNFTTKYNGHELERMLDKQVKYQTMQKYGKRVKKEGVK